jgi:hypothetical protein
MIYQVLTAATIKTALLAQQYRGQPSSKQEDIFHDEKYHLSETTNSLHTANTTI